MHQSGTIFTGTDSIKSFASFMQEAARKYSGIFILTDGNTREYCFPILAGRFDLPVNAVILEIESGEKSKNLETCMNLWYELAMLGADRYSLMLCLGGGVVCDIGGFISSTYQRGIDFVYLPTSLLAQVDAAIGGKTGVNLDKLKNYVGVFSPPKAVYIFTVFLQTLPFRELLAGYAEVIKHALLSSEKSFRQLVTRFPDKKSIESSHDWIKVVEHSVKIKNNVVNSDPMEQGIRKVLNLGHTVGHAFESHSLGNEGTPLLHGYAVAMGLIVEAKLSVHLCGFPAKLADEITSYISSVFPFYEIDADEIPEIIELMGFDKKNKAGNIQITLMKKPGDLLTDIVCAKEDIEKCLAEYLNIGKSYIKMHE